MMKLADADSEFVRNADDQEVVGEIESQSFRQGYTKADLLALKSFRLNSGAMRIHRQSSRHGQACEYVRFQIMGQSFYAIHHDPNGPGEVPTASLPFLLEAYSTADIDHTRSHTFVLGPPTSPETALALSRFIESVVLSGHNWSILKHARDVYFEPPASGVEIYQRLISDAYSSNLIKYSFFDLFRCIERAALEKLLAKINSDFYNDPSKTIEHAQRSLSSDRLLLEVPLDAQRRIIVAAFERFELLKKTNKFIQALYASLRDSMSSDKFKAGLSLLYKVRCTIAHAKAGDILIEAYSDYEAALEQVTLYVEMAALEYAGFTLDVALV